QHFPSLLEWSPQTSHLYSAIFELHLPGRRHSRSGVRLRHNLLAIKCSLLYNRFSFSNSSSLAGFEAEVGPDGLEYFVFAFPEMVYKACAWNSKPLAISPAVAVLGML